MRLTSLDKFSNIIPSFKMDIALNVAQAKSEIVSFELMMISFELRDLVNGIANGWDYPTQEVDTPWTIA